VGRRVRLAEGADAKRREVASDLRIGLLGGTFDPPHLGHLWLAETSHQQLQLDKVLFMPVGLPPHKSGRTVAPVVDRIQMVKLATRGVDYFAVDSTDIFRPPPHTMVTLIPLIRSMFPMATIWLLVGMDSIRELGSWHLPGQIISQCRLAALPRPGVTVDWQRLDTSVKDVKRAVDHLEGPQLDISSSLIRQRLRDRLTVRYLVPTAVGDYIEEKQLYL